MRALSNQITDRRDPIQEFADRIIAELDKGVRPGHGTPTKPADPKRRSIPSPSTLMGA